MNLNLSRPYLRRDDVYAFECESEELKLINPHIGLKSLGMNDLLLLLMKYVYFNIVQHIKFYGKKNISKSIYSERWKAVHCERRLFILSLYARRF